MNRLRLAITIACIGLQAACTQAGETDRATRPAEMHACPPGAAPPCGPPTAPANRGGPGLEPAVPPVPESPIKTDCSRLPTQVERDTCTNRKESTG